MSEQDIAIVEQTLKGLMIPDNNIRREAEVKLEELMSNRSGLVFCLSNILLSKFKSKRLIKFIFSLWRSESQSLLRCCAEEAAGNQGRRNREPRVESRGRSHQRRRQEKHLGCFDRRQRQVLQAQVV